MRLKAMVVLAGRSDPAKNSVNAVSCGADSGRETTARFGTDPGTSVLDPFCRAWDLDNLYVVDASFLPSSTGFNPSLTIVAQALRTAEHILEGWRMPEAAATLRGTPAPVPA